MKTLYLVRHAKSSWKFPELTDAQRPLNKRGKRDAPDMGSRLFQLGLKPDLLVSSHANRALTTAKTIAGQLNFPQAQIQIDKRIYHADTDDLLKVVRSLNNNADIILLFGHNPGFTDFANELTHSDIYNIPTCGVFGCTFDIDDWNSVRYGKGTRIHYDFPKNR